jgi:hypothetical protein
MSVGSRIVVAGRRVSWSKASALRPPACRGGERSGPHRGARGRPIHPHAPPESPCILTTSPRQRAALGRKPPLQAGDRTDPRVLPPARRGRPVVSRGALPPGRGQAEVPGQQSAAGARLAEGSPRSGPRGASGTSSRSGRGGAVGGAEHSRRQGPGGPSAAEPFRDRAGVRSGGLLGAGYGGCARRSRGPAEAAAGGGHVEGSGGIGPPGPRAQLPVRVPEKLSAGKNINS